MLRVFATVRTGLVIACSDVLFMVNPDAAFDWSRPGVTGLGVPMAAHHGEHHGVYHGDSAGAVSPRRVYLRGRTCVDKVGCLCFGGWVWQGV